VGEGRKGGNIPVWAVLRELKCVECLALVKMGWFSLVLFGLVWFGPWSGPLCVGDFPNASVERHTFFLPLSPVFLVVFLFSKCVLERQLSSCRRRLFFYIFVRFCLFSKCESTLSMAAYSSC
jgi:hypothetical protein